MDRQETNAASENQGQAAACGTSPGPDCSVPKFSIPEIRRYMQGGLLSDGTSGSASRAMKENNALLWLIAELDDVEDGIEASTLRHAMRGQNQKLTLDAHSASVRSEETP